MCYNLIQKQFISECQYLFSEKPKITYVLNVFIINESLGEKCTSNME